MVRTVFLSLLILFTGCSILSAIDGRKDAEIKNIKTSYRLTSSQDVIYHTVAQSHPDWKDRRFRKSSATGAAFTQLTREAEKWFLWGQDAAHELGMELRDVDWRISCEKVVWETKVGQEKTDPMDGMVFIELTSYPLSAISYFQSQHKDSKLAAWADLMKKKFQAQAR